MSKEMIVSVNGREKKIAIMENGKVTEFYIERGEENSGVVGNVYKGRVMRVLPGMQSAFVDIGLERDAFLYVSDFFDEEEEIERIVMEKGKKGSPEDAKREANEQIDRARIEREKQMESVQEIAEPLTEGERETKAKDKHAETKEKAIAEETSTEEVPAEKPKRGRGRKKKEEAPAVEAEAPVFEVDFDASGFERISDDSDTGDMFKDAYVQEAIVDRVRAAEFDMETTPVAEVGSLIADVDEADGGFERIADEDETPAPAKRRGRTKKTGTEEEKAPVKPKARAKKPTGKFAKPKAKKAKKDGLEDAEASHKESDDIAEMAVRRGGRGRRRGTKSKEDGPDESTESQNGNDVLSDEIVEVNKPEPQPAESSPEPTGDTQDDRSQSRDDRPRYDNRGGRGSRGGRGRNDRPQSGDGKRYDRNDRGGRPPQPAISDLLKEGQEILVQIAKEPIAKKGARITSHIALPGRFLVYMPTIEHLGVSRKIESSNERGRLRTLIQRIRQDKEIPSGGFIVRTAGIGISEEDLRNDAKYLVRMWMESKKSSEKKRSPAVVHKDLDLVQRILRDQLSDDFTAIRVDSEEEYLQHGRVHQSDPAEIGQKDQTLHPR